jgi:hypothetical protein
LQSSFCFYYKQVADGVDANNYFFWEKRPFDKNWLPPTANNNGFTPADNIFNKYMAGLILGFGFKKVINEEYLLQAGVRFDYDLTNANNLDAKYYYSSNAYPYYESALHYNPWRLGEPVEARKTTHNIRTGLNFSISYFLNN